LPVPAVTRRRDKVDFRVHQQKFMAKFCSRLRVVTPQMAF
jgi:hypothetical protein